MIRSLQEIYRVANRSVRNRIRLVSNPYFSGAGAISGDGLPEFVSDIDRNGHDNVVSILRYRRNLRRKTDRSIGRIFTDASRPQIQSVHAARIVYRDRKAIRDVCRQMVAGVPAAARHTVPIGKLIVANMLGDCPRIPCRAIAKRNRFQPARSKPLGYRNLAP